MPGTVPQVLWSHLITTILRIRSPFYRWGHWARKRQSDLPEALQLMSEKARIQTRAHIFTSRSQKVWGLSMLKDKSVAGSCHPGGWPPVCGITKKALQMRSNRHSQDGPGHITETTTQFPHLKNLAYAYRPCLFLEVIAKIRWAKSIKNISNSINNF